MQVQGKVAAVAGNGSGFKVNDQWYNIVPGTQQPPRNSMVSFTAVPDPSGRGQQAQNLQITGQAQGGGGYGGKRGGGGGRQKSPRDIYGPIVGHNLLIAATLLGPGHSVGELVNLAREVTAASEALVNEIVQQKSAPAPQQQQPVPQQQYQQPAQQYQQPQQPPQQQQYQQQPQQAPQPAPGYDNFDDDIPF